VVGIGSHVGEQFVEAVEDLVGDAIVETGPAHHGIGTVADDVSNHHLIAIQCAIGPSNGGIDQRAMTIFSHDYFENLAQGCGDIEIDSLFFDRALEHGAETVLVERGDRVPEKPRGTKFQPAFTAAWRLQKASYAAGQIDVAHALGHQTRDQEIVLEKIRKRVADPVLVAGDDGSVRYGQTHGMPE